MPEIERLLFEKESLMHRCAIIILAANPLIKKIEGMKAKNNEQILIKVGDLRRLKDAVDEALRV